MFCHVFLQAFLNVATENVITRVAVNYISTEQNYMLLKFEMSFRHPK